MFGILKELYTETYSIKCRLSLAFVDPDLIGFGLSVSSLNGQFEMPTETLHIEDA